MFPIKDTIPHRYTPFVVYFIIAINIFVFIIELSLPYPQRQLFFYNFGLVPLKVTQYGWDFYSLFTNMFLHGGWFHIISNMWALWIFGDNVEDRMGHFRFFIFYILCGLAANLVHYYFNQLAPVPVIGASGAIAGVMGAYMVMFPTSRIITLIPIFFIPFFFEIPAVIFLFFWFISQVIAGTFTKIFMPPNVGGIAWWAHIGGFIAGIILHKFFIKKNRYRDFFSDEIYFRYL
jgi:membrane associated rhomboid family serine protease